MSPTTRATLKEAFGLSFAIVFFSTAMVVAVTLMLGPVK